MVQIVKLANKEGQDLFVNADAILYFQPTTNGTALYFSSFKQEGTSRIYVKETPAQLMKILGGKATAGDKVDAAAAKPAGKPAPPKPAIAQPKGPRGF